VSEVWVVPGVLGSSNPVLWHQLLSGLLGGIVASLMAWALVFKVFIPRVEFSDHIGKSKTRSRVDGSEWEYRVKIANVGRRPVVDVTILARLVFPNALPGRTSTLGLALSGFGHEALKVACLYPSKRGQSGNRRLLHLSLRGRLDYLKVHDAFERVRDRVTQGVVTVEDLLQEFSGSYLQISVFGSDGWSGARRAVTSKRYAVADVRRGVFERTSLRVEVADVSKSDEMDQ